MQSGGGSSYLSAAPIALLETNTEEHLGRRDSRKGHPVYLAPDTSVAPSTMLLQTQSDALPLVARVRTIVQEEAPSVIADVRTIAEIENESRRTFRLVTGGLAGSALLALFLSAVGLYAVVSFAASQRASEIAVRMAIGAHPRQIAGSFITDGLRLSMIGLVLGLPISLIGLRAVKSLPDAGIPKVELGPVTVLGVIGVLIVAAAATLVPARRAASTDPARVLCQT